MRQRLPYGLQSNKTACTYEIKEEDWKPDEGYAYNNDRSLDIVVKVVYSTSPAGFTDNFFELGYLNCNMHTCRPKPMKRELVMIHYELLRV